MYFESISKEFWDNSNYVNGILKKIKLKNNRKILDFTTHQKRAGNSKKKFQYQINKVILIEPNKVKAFQFPIQYYTAVCSKNVGKL